MNNAAFTIIQNDMVILELWCKYYSKDFKDLYVITCGTKKEYCDKLEEFKQKYNLQVQEYLLADYEPWPSAELIRVKQNELLKDHKWVLFSCSDEYVVPSFSCDKNLTDFMRRCGMQWAWCLGYDVIQTEDEQSLDYTKPILGQRSKWVKTPNINKVLLSKVPLDWGVGQHQCSPTHGVEPTEMGDMGLTLIHLKHADLNRQGGDLGPVFTKPWPVVMDHLKEATEIPKRLKEFI